MDSRPSVPRLVVEDHSSGPPLISGPVEPEETDYHARLLKQVSDQGKELHELRQAVQALCEVQAPGHPRTRLHQESQKRELARQVWSEIRDYDLLQDTEGNLREYTKKDAPSLKELVSPIHEYPWTSWAWRQSYPHLARFIENVGTAANPRLQVTCTERTETDKIIIRESKPPLHDHASLWNHISTRFTGIPNTSNPWDTTPSDTRMWVLALTRTLNVRDLDPTLAVILLASIPKIHVSMAAAFLDRHIAFRNWASASSWPLRHAKRNAFTFEYHIAFYSVSPTEITPDLAVRDQRGLRRSAVFGPNDDQTDRWIHEEELSFFLVGMGRSVFTCYHLSERYHNTPEASFAFRADRYKGATAVFMNWLTSSFHHVAWRWQRIINALNEKIHTSSDIVFSAENPDLLADDSQFTKSRTYFWALQTYKMFDEKLAEIIKTWEKFRRDKFYEVNDGLLPNSHLDLGIERIEASVEKLRGLQEVVRKKYTEVESLRQGLFGASALFDSRTAVRQGDNIRLLTYNTLLFLPLTFTTSIYGMQVVLPQLPVIYFYITLPCVVVAAALVMFNMQNLFDLYDAIASKITLELREVMSSHHREEWREMGELLRRDRQARQTPIRKIQRSTTHWDYVLFLIESVVFDLPVHELTWAWRSCRKLKSFSGKKAKRSSAHIPRPTKMKSRAARVMAVHNSENLSLTARPRNVAFEASMRVLSVLWIAFRIIWLPIWVQVIIIEYLLILPFVLFKSEDEFESTTTPKSKSSRFLVKLVRPLVWVGFGRQRNSNSSSSADPLVEPPPAAWSSGTASPESFPEKTEAEEKAEALEKIVKHVAAHRQRTRAARSARRSLHGHGVRSTSGLASPVSPIGSRPRTMSTASRSGR